LQNKHSFFFRSVEHQGLQKALKLNQKRLKPSGGQIKSPVIQPRAIAKQTFILLSLRGAPGPATKTETQSEMTETQWWIQGGLVKQESQASLSDVAPHSN